MTTPLFRTAVPTSTNRKEYPMNQRSFLTLSLNACALWFVSVWCPDHAITAASARCPPGIRFVRATVPLPTGVDERNCTGEPVGEVGMGGMECQELQHGGVKVLNVLGLGFVPPTSVSRFALGVSFGGPFDFKFGTDLLDGGCR